MRLALVIAVPVIMVFVVLATAKEAPKPPMFIRWLKPADPGDQTIQVYWRRVNSGKATPEDLVDLGSMLYLRGYPKDAIRMYERALDQDKKMYEAWFRIGLVEHREGNLRAARRAYRKCLKELTGHGWCNFYMGLLQEQMGKPGRALDYYRRAFKFAPALADPEVNPELLYSKLQLGAVLRHNERQRFTTSMPMDFLRPERVAEVRSRFEDDAEAAADDDSGGSSPIADADAVKAPSEAKELAPEPASRPKALPTPGLRPAPDAQTVVDRQRRRSPIRLGPTTPSAVGSDEPAPPPPPPRRTPVREPGVPDADGSASAPGGADPRGAAGGTAGGADPGGSSSGSSNASSGAGYPPQVGSASSEAYLLPWWPGELERMARNLGGPTAVPYQVPDFTRHAARPGDPPCSS